MTSAMDRLCDTKWVNIHLQSIIWRRHQQYTAEYEAQVTQYLLDKIKQTPRKPSLFGCQFAHHESYKRPKLRLCGNNPAIDRRACDTITTELERTRKKAALL